MTCIDVSMKHHDLVMICDVTEHILPSKSAKEGSINYCMSQNLRNHKILQSLAKWEGRNFCDKYFANESTRLHNTKMASNSEHKQSLFHMMFSWIRATTV